MTNTSSQRFVRGERNRVVKEGGYLRGFRPIGLGMETLWRKGLQIGDVTLPPAVHSRRATGFRSSTGWTRTRRRWPTTESSNRATSTLGVARRPRVSWSGSTPDESGGVAVCLKRTRRSDFTEAYPPLDCFADGLAEEGRIGI
jgi:hypothetical protein